MGHKSILIEDGNVLEPGDLQKRIAGMEPCLEMSRAIVMESNLILLVHQKLTGLWNIPGGRIGAGEDPEEAVVRELREETGYSASGLEHLFDIYEIHDGMLYLTHYFSCSISGNAKPVPTEREERLGQHPSWRSLSGALEEFGAGNLAARSSHWRGEDGGYKQIYRDFADYLDVAESIYARDETALSAFARMLG